MNNAREILQKYKAGTCTEDEKLLVEKWLLNYRAGKRSGLSDEDLEQSREETWQQVRKATQRVRSRSIWPRLVAAAVLIIIMSAGLWFYRSTERSHLKAKSDHKEIIPGGNKAVLTLANGKKVVLGALADGEIAKQAGIQITKTKDGQLVYKVLDRNSAAGTAQLAYNTIETPRGGQYQVILPDNSHVWLNAASSLRYPTFFGTKERKVQLKGEAYFEVQYNRDVPFKVETEGQLVEVLGTHFNINSYPDEPATKTTLVSGSVKVHGLSAKNSKLLIPGEQSALTRSGILNKVAGVNIDEVVAWKNQLFYFDNSDVEVVMRQLSRWYDVEVEYEGNIPQVRLSGEMYRSTKVTKVLDVISYFNIKYRIEDSGGQYKGRKIIISQ